MNLLIVDDEYYTVESISNKIRTLRNRLHFSDRLCKI